MPEYTITDLASIETAVALLGAGADPNRRDAHGWTALHLLAWSEGTASQVELLLNSGADVNARSVHGETPLMIAADQKEDGSWDVAESLLRFGADANLRDCDGDTALHRAAASGSIALIALLIAHAAEVNAQDAEGRTPLHWALAQPNKEAVSSLLNQGANPNIQDNIGGDSFIALARSWRGRYPEDDAELVQLIEILIQSGANCKQLDRLGQSAYDIAREHLDPRLAARFDEPSA